MSGVLADLRARLIANVHAAAVERLGPDADHDRAVRAIDALMPDVEAAFTDGADPSPVDPACWPSPGQWVARFLGLHGHGRLCMAEKAIVNAQRADECLRHGHADLLGDVAEAVADRRDLVTLTAWMAANGWDASEVARAVEKTYAYADELVLAKHAAEALADPGISAAMEAS